MGSRFPRCQRGVFTARVGSIVLQHVRDEEGLQLLSDGRRDLAFIGSDKFTELQLNGSLTDPSVIDRIPIECTMVLAGLPDENLPIYMKLGRPLTVATSYPFTLSEALRTSSANLKPVYVSGASEGYVASGLNDLVFDIKAKGDTLRENGLTIYQESSQLTLNVLDACNYDPRSGGDKLLKGMNDVAAILAERCEQINSADVESYTLSLMRSPNQRTKKLFEEFGELVQELQRESKNRSRIISEAADFLYNLQVFLALEGITLIDVLREDIRRNKQ